MRPRSTAAAVSAPRQFAPQRAAPSLRGCDAAGNPDKLASRVSAAPLVTSGSHLSRTLHQRARRQSEGRGEFGSSILTRTARPTAASMPALSTMRRAGHWIARRTMHPGPLVIVFSLYAASALPARRPIFPRNRSTASLRRRGCGTGSNRSETKSLFGGKSARSASERRMAAIHSYRDLPDRGTRSRQESLPVTSLLRAAGPTALDPLQSLDRPDERVGTARKRA